jgi:hypothetical protein
MPCSFHKGNDVPMHESQSIHFTVSRVRKTNSVKAKAMCLITLSQSFHFSLFFSVNTLLPVAVVQTRVPNTARAYSSLTGPHHDPYSFHLCYLCRASSICSGNCIDSCSFGARTGRRHFVDSGSLCESVWEPLWAWGGVPRYRNWIYLRTLV